MTEKKPPLRGRLPLPHFQYTQDYLDEVAWDIERRKAAGEKFPTHAELMDELRRLREKFYEDEPDTTNE